MILSCPCPIILVTIPSGVVILLYSAMDVQAAFQRIEYRPGPCSEELTIEESTKESSRERGVGGGKGERGRTCN